MCRIGAKRLVVLAHVDIAGDDHHPDKEEGPDEPERKDCLPALTYSVQVSELLIRGYSMIPDSS
jgi:hypothetical protein